MPEDLIHTRPRLRHHKIIHRLGLLQSLYPSYTAIIQISCGCNNRLSFVILLGEITRLSKGSKCLMKDTEIESVLKKALILFRARVLL
jgi:hypothetical protein